MKTVTPLSRRRHGRPAGSSGAYRVRRRYKAGGVQRHRVIHKAKKAGRRSGRDDARMGSAPAPQETEAFKALRSEHEARAAVIPENYSRVLQKLSGALVGKKEEVATAGPRIKTTRRKLESAKGHRSKYTFDGGPRRPAYVTGQTVFGFAELFMASQVVEKLFDLVGVVQYLVAGGLSTIIASFAHFTAHVIEEMLADDDTDPRRRRALRAAAAAYLVLVAVLIGLQGYVRAEDLADLQGPTGGNVPVSAGFLVAVQSCIFAMALNLARRRVRGKPVRDLDDQISDLEDRIDADTEIIETNRIAIPQLGQWLKALEQREKGDGEVEEQLYAQLCGTFCREYEQSYKQEKLGGSLLRRLLRWLFPQLLGVDRAQVRQLPVRPHPDEEKDARSAVEEDVA